MFHYRYLVLLMIIFTGLCFLLTNRRYIDTGIFTLTTQSLLQHHQTIRDRKGVIDTEGCTIPNLETLDPVIRSYVEYPVKMPKCRNATLLLENNRTTIWVRSKSFNFYNISVRDKLDCCYQSFYRPVSIRDITSRKIDDRVKYNSCVSFNDTINVEHEFVKVMCTVNAKLTYEQFFLFAPEKKFTKHGEVDQITNKTGYNVLIVGMDSVSRLNFLRTMPKTADYLKRKGAIDMLGYNKVGYNTLPNLVPMLLGVKKEEMKKVCLPRRTSTFDNCPFIWEWYKQAGYYTAYAEECAQIATFNYLKSGFAGTPTDYYPRTLFREAERYVGPCAKLCMNNIYYYKVLLNYIEDITWRLKSKRLFGLFWENSMSHDDLNWPMKMDQDYKNMFVNLEASGYLNETFVFIVSDHGIRWGPIRSTKQGYLEERLPLLYILTPKSFQVNHRMAYNNLKLNTHRLTTPFDVYETLNDLIDLKNVEDSLLLERCKESYALRRGISLFLPVPSNRTCKAADIDDQWCTCRQNVPLPKDHPKAVEAAQSVANMLNYLLEAHSQCAKLMLTDVVDAREIQVEKTDKEKNPWRELMVVIKTAPNNAVFEATVRNNIKEQSWHLVGLPSRLTTYGKQSMCINDYKLKSYCYCSI